MTILNALTKVSRTHPIESENIFLAKVICLTFYERQGWSNRTSPLGMVLLEKATVDTTQSAQAVML